MNDFYELLQKIKKRPAMYLGRHSIFSLQAFLDGYYYARREASIPLTEQEQEFQQFLQWIRARFKVETGQLWASILLFHAADEKDAVERAYLLLKFNKLPNSRTTRWLNTLRGLNQPSTVLTDLVSRTRTAIRNDAEVQVTFIGNGKPVSPLAFNPDPSEIRRRMRELHQILVCHAP